MLVTPLRTFLATWSAMKAWMSPQGCGVLHFLTATAALASDDCIAQRKPAVGHLVRCGYDLIVMWKELPGF